MKKTGLFYGYQGGNTEEVAQIIANEFGPNEIDVFDLSKISLLKLEDYNTYIFGISTIGADNWTDASARNVWDNFFMLIEKLNVKDKKAAIFGLGNQILYPDHFCDDMGMLKDKLEAQGMKIVGETSPEGYSFTGSNGFRKNLFVGLPIDHDNEPELTHSRIKNWVEKLKNQF